MKNREVLLKVVKNADGDISLDKSGKIPGRGAYICKENECILSAEKKRAFERAFKGQVPPSLYEDLRNELK